MSQDEEHLNLLGIFHYILGALTILVSSIFLFHVGMGIAVLSGMWQANDTPPQFIGWMFLIMGAMGLLFGWMLGILMITAGRKLQRHTSRTFCLVIAGIECLLTPFGTILGIFTIVELTKESVVALFESSNTSSAG